MCRCHRLIHIGTVPYRKRNVLVLNSKLPYAFSAVDTTCLDVSTDDAVKVFQRNKQLRTVAGIVDGFKDQFVGILLFAIAGSNQFAANHSCVFVGQRTAGVIVQYEKGCFKLFLNTKSVKSLGKCVRSYVKRVEYALF